LGCDRCDRDRSGDSTSAAKKERDGVFENVPPGEFRRLPADLARPKMSAIFPTVFTDGKSLPASKAAGNVFGGTLKEEFDPSNL